MSEEYFIRRGTTVKGPISLEKLRAAHAMMKLTSSDEISTSAEGPWKKFAAVDKDLAEGRHPRLSSKEKASGAKSVDERRIRHERLRQEASDAGSADDELASLTEASAMAEKLPRLPPRRKKKQVDKRTNRNRNTARFSIWHLIKGFVSQYSWIAYSMMTLSIVVVGVAGIVQGLNSAAKVKPGISGREQLKFIDRTTAKWIELEKEQKARRAEGLWRDNRWMPLEQVLGVDWAALPDWFDALQHPNSNRLAEEILKKWEQSEGHPYPEDLIAGLKSPNQRVQYWSILIIKKLKNQNDKDALISELERFRDGDDKVLSDAAVQTLRAIRPQLQSDDNQTGS